MGMRSILVVAMLLATCLIALSTLTAYATLITGTVYVNKSGTLVKLGNVVSPKLFVLKFVYSGFVKPVEIYSNSTYIVNLPEGAVVSVYIAQAMNTSKAVQALFYYLGILSKTYKIPPQFIVGVPIGPINIVVSYSDLMKIMPVFPKFKFSIVKMLPETCVVGKEYTVEVLVSNVGNATGTAIVALYLNSTLVKSRKVNVAPGKSVTVDLSVVFNKTGIYNITITGNGKAIPPTPTYVKVIKITKPQFKVVNVSVPEKFYVGVPGTVKVIVQNTGTVPVTANITVLALVKVITGLTVVGRNSTLVYLMPGETKVVSVELTFESPGKPAYVKVIANSTPPYEKEFPITLVVPPVTLVIGAERKYKLYVGQELTIPLILVNMTKVYGISVNIMYNRSVVKVLNVTRGNCSFAKFMKHIVNGTVKIVAISFFKPLGVYKCVMYMTIKAVNTGETRIYGNGTITTYSGIPLPMHVIPTTVVVTKPSARIVVVNFTVPPKAYVNVPFPVHVVLKNVGTVPGTVNVTVVADSVVCGSATAYIKPGMVWSHVFTCRFTSPGVHTVKLLLNGTVVKTATVTVSKISVLASIKLIPKMYVYWAGYPVMVTVSVKTLVPISELNVTVVMMQPPLKPKVVISRVIPSPTPGKVYNISSRVILPTFTTKGALVVCVNGAPVNATKFMTTGVAVILKPYTYELISVPLVPKSPIPSIPTPPPTGSAPINLPTLEQVYSLAIDAVTGEKVSGIWNLVQIYYYNTIATKAPYYIPWSPTAPVRPGMGFVVYSTYPDTVVLIMPINVTEMSPKEIMALIHYSLAVAYVPFPGTTAGWMIAGPIGLTPIKLLPSPVENVTLYYTESKTSEKWTTIIPVTVGDYVVPGKGYWIFWSIVTYHAIHGNMKMYLGQMFKMIQMLKGGKVVT